MSRWNPADHPRDGDGQFANSPGGGASDTSKMADAAIRRAAGRAPALRQRTENGMPDALATHEIPLTGGGVVKLDRHLDGGISLTSGPRSTTPVSRNALKKLFGQASLAEDWDPGEEQALPGIGHVRKKSSSQYEVTLPDGSKVDLARRDIARILKSLERIDSAARVNTDYGPIDVFPVDAKTLGIRHLGDDGRPVEILLNRGSFEKIDRAVNGIIDDIDLDGDQAVTRRVVSTNAGKVSVEMFGDGRATNPRSELNIGPVDGDAWGVIVDGPHLRDWYSAMESVALGLEWL